MVFGGYRFIMKIKMLFYDKPFANSISELEIKKVRKIIKREFIAYCKGKMLL